MTARTRHRLRRELSAFASAGPRTRTVIVTGPEGAGVTHTLDLLHADLLVAGMHVVVMDDVHELDDAALLDLDARLAAHPGTRVLLGGRQISDEARAVLARHGDVRLVPLPALDVRDVREMVAELGIPQMSHRAWLVSAHAEGMPRRVLDLAFDELDLSYGAGEDPSLTGAGWVASCARRLDAAMRDDADARDALLTAAHDEASPEAHALLADVALLDHDLDAATRHAAAAVEFAEDDVTRHWAQALLAAARGFGNDASALLDLRTLAGVAERDGYIVCASAIQLLTAQVSCVLADVATTRRAAVRSIELADAVGAIALAASARVVLVDMLLAGGEAGEASAYAEDLELLAEARGWETLVNVALTSRSRAELALGRPEDAAIAADRALERALSSGSARFVAIESAVLSARAHAATGSVDVALAVIDRITTTDGDAVDVDFWLDLEAIRILGATPAAQPAELSRRIAAFASYPTDGHGGALEAAHAEVAAWKAFASGAHVDAGRRIARARELWAIAECHDELLVTECIVEAAAHAAIELEAAAAPQEDPAAFDVLTKREREIARYVAGGMTNPEIAAELHLSARTVEHHVGSILRKLELTSRRALVRGQL